MMVLGAFPSYNYCPEIYKNTGIFLYICNTKHFCQNGATGKIKRVRLSIYKPVILYTSEIHGQSLLKAPASILILVHPFLHKTTVQVRVKPLQAEHSLIKRKPFFSFETDRNLLFNTITEKWRPTFLKAFTHTKDISQDQN